MRFSERVTRFVDFFHVAPLRRVVSVQTFRYVVCGATNMALGWLIYYAVFHYLVGGRWLDLGFVEMSPHVQALFIQFPITFLTGFWLNRNVTFRLSPLRGRTQFFRYILQNAGSFVVNYFALKLFVDGVGIFPTIAKPIADGVTVIYSYLTARFFTFSGSVESNS